MSDTALTEDALQRNKRLIMRSINSSKASTEKALAEQPSDSAAHRAAVHLDEWKASISKLEEVVNDLLDFVETDGKSEAQIEAAEAKVSEDLISQQRTWAHNKAKLNAMIKGLDHKETPTGRPSLVGGDGTPGNPLVKLPDIPVPKFNGEMKNFTEWHAMFKAMVHDNEALEDVQKLYFLKQAMMGDAAHLLKYFWLDESMYAEVYKFVLNRFHNKRAIIGMHFKELVGLPEITVKTLRESLDKVNAIIRGLKVCGLDIDKMSPLITFIVVQKLPELVRVEWENSHYDYSTYPGFEPLHTFLQNRCFAYESGKVETVSKASGASALKGPQAKKSGQQETPKRKSSFSSTAKNAGSGAVLCPLCAKGHYLSQCSKFLESSVSERYGLVKRKNLYANCFRSGHIAADCRSSSCRKCQKPHNTLLHREILTTEPKKEQDTSEKPADDSKKKATLLVTARKDCVVLLPSAVANVHLGQKIVKVRILIDTCSQVNLVTEKLVRNCHLRMVRSSTEIIGVSHLVTIQLGYRFSHHRVSIDAEVVTNLPYKVVPEYIRFVLGLAADLQLADCTLKTDDVDILIGGEFAHQVLLNHRKFIGDLCLQESHLGLVAQGPIPTPGKHTQQSCNLIVAIEEALTQFWEAEEVEPSSRQEDDLDACESHFQATHSRLPDGRFEVRLPFKNMAERLTNTRNQAIASLIKFEKKYNEEVRDSYKAFMADYLELGHMVPVPKDSARYYIPHLPVLRPSSSSTKLRVVFNASAKNNTGESLNEILMKGPPLQPELFDTLIGFRKYQLAFSANILKMYRQVSMHPEDRRFQTILWRDDPSKEIQEYQLTTLMYGTTPASYLATKCLQMLAEEVKEDQPR